MATPDILLTAPLLPATLRALEASFTVHRLYDRPDPAPVLAEVGARIRGIATTAFFGTLDDRLLDELPALEIIASFGVGYDHVDATAAAARGVVVTNTPGVLDDEVADFTIGLLLATIRQFPQADLFLREGRWLQGQFPLSPTLRGRRIGIVGLGNIGKAIARRLEGFGVAIAYHGRSRQADVAYRYCPTLLELAETCDVLIVIVPGGDATRGLIDGAVLAALGPDGILINVARGSVVDEVPLIEALRAGTILAAGLDVYEDEPRVPQALIDLPNTVLLPHIGSASIATRTAIGQLLVDNLKAWFETGRPITPVPESAGLLG